MSVDCVNQLGFHRPLTSLVKESLVVRNPNNRPVAFKIKTTAPKQYCVRPNSGRIEPGQEVEVQVLFQAMKEEPPQDIKCRDKFLVQSTTITAEHESSSISVLWTAVESKNRDDIHERKIRCMFLPADGSATMQSSAHETYDGSSTPAYHAAEFSASGPVHNDLGESAATRSITTTANDRTGLFQPEPALASRETSEIPPLDGALQSRLDDANSKIVTLQQQLDNMTSRSKKSTPKAVAHNEGVPVPLTALIALIAFLAAYLLF